MRVWLDCLLPPCTPVPMARRDSVMPVLPSGTRGGAGGHSGAAGAAGCAANTGAASGMVPRHATALPEFARNFLRSIGCIVPSFEHHGLVGRIPPMITQRF